MMRSVIEVEQLSKKYRLGVIGATTLREDLARIFRPAERGGADEFWALRAVSFEVQAGEVLGILGRNGAGKSTLLKILARITEPTTGRAVLRGRVASLLEVGTGFHPELTGRENVFLNGAILGMREREIRAQFDEIVAFADVGPFIDTPVKHYSSGMRVKLAFAVAAHLQAEIVIVDEVLAVGDVEFQRKCMGKMEQVARGEGRTVLFVSHNMAAVQSLCSRVLYLQQGQLRGMGPVDEQIAAYMRDAGPSPSGEGTHPVRLGSSLVLEGLKFSPAAVTTGGNITFEIQICSSAPVQVSDLALLIYSSHGSRVAVVDLRKPSGPRLVSGKQQIRVQILALPLVEGEYRVGIYVKTVEFNENVGDLATFNVVHRASANGVIPYSSHHRGLVELSFVVEE